MPVKLTPRKVPRQPRAKVTVEAILIAAERLSRDPGLEAWTTNHVAELAGVSVGSLYQYFPSKESLVAALYAQRHTARIAALADVLVDGPPRLGERVAVALLAGGAADHAFDLQLRAHLEAAGAQRKLRPLDDQAAQLLAQLLIAKLRWPEAPARRIGTLLWRALSSALAAALEHPDWLSDPRFPRELAVMIEAMLAPAPP